MNGLKALGVVVALCAMALPFWIVRQLHDGATDGAWRNGMLLEPGDAPELEADSIYVDSTGTAVPYRYKYFNGRMEKHP